MPRKADASQLRISISSLTRLATAIVPAIVLLGFVAAGAPWVGLAPAAIVGLTLGLVHRKLVALASELRTARRAVAEGAMQNVKLRKHAEALERRVAAHDSELERAGEVTAVALAKLVEARDPTTGSHLERVRAYARLLATQLARTPKYQAAITERFTSVIYHAAPLHDIGKVGIADSILFKPGKLTPEEYAVMRRHAAIGGRTLKAAAEHAPDNLFLRMSYEVALYHHERWDGGGYPFGLPGPQIPLAARIVALADVYDALTSERCYKPAYSHAEARSYLVSQARLHFDPDVVEAFLARERDFIRIRAALSDPQGLGAAELPKLVRDLGLLGAA